jgi:hypothetical protein
VLTPATTRSFLASPALPGRQNVRDEADAERIEELARELGRTVEPVGLCDLFDAIEPELYRFPAVDPAGRAAVESLAAQ